jgi:gamma-glutamyltranspeptidase/glutathione hydrolase
MYPGEMSVEQRVPEAVRKALVDRGHKLRVAGPWTMGSLAAIVVDPKSGVLSAGTDPRVDAYAIAW